MSMSAPSGGSNLNNDMNVTPMIDVLLVLLIIFMMIIPMSRKAIDTQLPDPTPQPPSAQVNPDQIVLDHVAAREPAIVGRAVDWANVNSGSRNPDGLARVLALLEAEARHLPAEVMRIPTQGSTTVTDDGAVRNEATLLLEMSGGSSTALVSSSRNMEPPGQGAEPPVPVPVHWSVRSIVVLLSVSTLDTFHVGTVPMMFQAHAPLV